MNMVGGRVGVGTDGSVSLDIAGQRLEVPEEALKLYQGLRARHGQTVIVGIRPEAFTFPADIVPAGQRLDIGVELVESTGAEVQVHFNLAVPPVDADELRELVEHVELEIDPTATSTPMVAKLDGMTRIRIAERVTLGVHAERCHFFDPATGLPLR